MNKANRFMALFAAMFVTFTIALTPLPSFSANTATTVKATVPTYTWELDYETVNFKYSTYPPLSYKDITYFPMTWHYCRLLGLTSVWVEGEGLFIASWGTYGPATGEFELPTYKGSRNPSTVTATVATYPIYVNGKKIDNSKEEYPLLNFRGVTYFPMTWRFAREEFDWDTEWSAKDNKFSVHWQIDDDTDYTISVYEETDTAAYIVKDICKQVVIGEKTYDDGETTEVYTTKDSEEFYTFDYATSKLTKSDKHESYETFISGDTSYLPVGHLASNIKLRTDREYTRDDIPAPYTPFVAKGYVSAYGKEYLIGEGIAIEDAVCAGDYVFVNARRYTGFKHFLCGNYELYRIDTAKGTVERLDTNYKDYASMKLLGTDNAGTLYVKCQQGSNSCQGDGGIMEASAYNDGYYTLNPDTGELKLLSRFVYTDGEILTPDGHIYGIFNWKNSIEKLY